MVALKVRSFSLCVAVVLVIDSVFFSPRLWLSNSCRTAQFDHAVNSNEGVAGIARRGVGLAGGFSFSRPLRRGFGGRGWPGCVRRDQGYAPGASAIDSARSLFAIIAHCQVEPAGDFCSSPASPAVELGSLAVFRHFGLFEGVAEVGDGPGAYSSTRATRRARRRPIRRGRYSPLLPTAELSPPAIFVRSRHCPPWSWARRRFFVLPASSKGFRRPGTARRRTARPGLRAGQVGGRFGEVVIRCNPRLSGFPTIGRRASGGVSSR